MQIQLTLPKQREQSQDGSQGAAVSPFTVFPLSEELGRARTWWRLEAQCCASLACALSVCSFPALSSTVTLPSPICLMNRRNYTITTTTTAITHLLLTGNNWRCIEHTNTQVHQWFLLDSYGQTQVNHKEEGVTAKGMTYPKLYDKARAELTEKREKYE